MCRSRSGSASTLVPVDLPQPCSRVLSYGSADDGITLVDFSIPDVQDKRVSDHYNVPGNVKKGFKNPWPSSKPNSWLKDIAQGPFIRKTKIPDYVKPLRSVSPTFTAVQEHEEMRVTWLGHASVLLQLPGDSSKPGPTILFDPILSKRASPFSSIGPRRFLDAPCQVHDLPHIDYVCISHSHYDHLDTKTIQALIERLGGERTQFFVPLGNRSALIRAGVSVDKIEEMDWWDEVETDSADGKQDKEASAARLRIVCTPAQHGSARSLFDRNQSLWCSWVVQYQSVDVHQQNFFFGGDTGYRSRHNGPVCPAFRQIGDLYGPYDLACIPIWRGACLSFLSKLGLRLQPEAFTRTSHCTPHDAIDMQRDLQAKTAIAIHFGTFVNEDEARWSVESLQLACREAGVTLRQAHAFGEQKKALKGPQDLEFVVLDAGEHIRCVGS